MVVEQDKIDNKFVSRLLWKMGFTPPQFTDFESRFQSRIEGFTKALIANSPIASEEQRESIREAGVNLFVSVEEFLDSLIVFNVWLLASDHFGVTRFQYDSKRARLLVPVVLGKSVNMSEDGDEVEWDLSKSNTLGVSLAYLNVASKWLNGLPEANRDSCRRSEVDMPHFAARDRLSFPFQHTQLWADCDITELAIYIKEFSALTKSLSQADLAGIRNGLDHTRDEYSFPTGDNMLACVTRLRDSLSIAMSRGFFPRATWLESYEALASGASELRFQDASGDITSFRHPPLATGMPTVSFGRPYVFPGRNLLGIPNCELPIRVTGSNEYTKYWQDYPRRRSIRTATVATLKSEEV
jgi:hypothetical protein